MQFGLDSGSKSSKWNEEENEELTIGVALVRQVCGNRQDKPAALVELALDPDLATVQTHQLSADRQPKSGTTKSPRVGAVYL